VLTALQEFSEESLRSQCGKYVGEGGKRDCCFGQ